MISCCLPLTVDEQHLIVKSAPEASKEANAPEASSSSARPRVAITDWRTAPSTRLFDDLHIGAFAGLFEAEEHGPSQQDTMEFDLYSAFKPNKQANVAPRFGKIQVPKQRYQRVASAFPAFTVQLGSKQAPVTPGKGRACRRGPATTKRLRLEKTATSKKAPDIGGLFADLLLRFSAMASALTPHRHAPFNDVTRVLGNPFIPTGHGRRITGGMVMRCARQML